jgi:hypothetical protein
MRPCVDFSLERSRLEPEKVEYHQVILLHSNIAIAVVQYHKSAISGKAKLPVMSKLFG